MVRDSVILFTVGANLVATLTATHLLSTLGISRLALSPLSFLLQAFVEDVESDTAVLMLVATVNFDRYSGFPVREDHARIRLVAMLATRPGVSGEPHIHVSTSYLNACCLLCTHNCHRYSGSMHAAAAFVGWYSLPAMPAGFLTQTFQRFALALND
jgi:hypothetical protein